MSKPPRQNVVAIPTAALIGPLSATIRQLAANSANVLFSGHAQARMAERGITDVEAIRALRLGNILGVPWHEPEIGGRGCKVVFQPRGGRAVGVITVVLEATSLLIKTVEWEDQR